MNFAEIRHILPERNLSRTFKSLLKSDRYFQREICKGLCSPSTHSLFLVCVLVCCCCFWVGVFTGEKVESFYRGHVFLLPVYGFSF